METQITTTSARKNLRSSFKPLEVSSQPWSLALPELTLHPDFGGFINHFLGRKENIHLVSIAWDYSTLNSTIYPRLNFKANKLPMELNPGYPELLKNYILFPQKKVVDSLNVTLFFFKSKNGGSVHEIVDLLESTINLSLLSQKLTSLTPENAADKKSAITHVSDTLCTNIEQIIKKSEYRFITTFHLKYTVDEEWNFFGEEVIQNGGIRIQLAKNKI